MADFSFKIPNENSLQADLLITDGDFFVGNDLETSASISLLSDARADDDEYAEYAGQFQVPPLNRGFWADTFRTTKLGSKLWLLDREKRTEQTRSRAEAYTREAFQYLVDNGICKEINVIAAFRDSNKEVLDIGVDLIKQDGETINQSFAFAWDSIIGDVVPPPPPPQSYDVYDFDFSTLTLPSTISDPPYPGHAALSKALIGSPLGDSGTEWTVPSASTGSKGVQLYLMGLHDSNESYGTNDFELGVTVSTRDIALNSTNGGVNITFGLTMSDGSGISLQHLHRTALPVDKWRVAAYDDTGAYAVIQAGSFDETDALWKLTREGDNIKAYYNGVHYFTRAIAPTVTIRNAAITVLNSPGDTRPQTWYVSFKDFYAKDYTGSPMQVPGS